MENQIELRLADLDKDGNLDILADGPEEGVMLIYFGRGGGAFSNSPLELEGYPNDVQLNTGDFNKDGNLDIAITYFENKLADGTHLQIFLGDGARNFTVGQNVVINSQCNNIEVSDLNKDGNLDLVLAGAGSENGTGLFISSYLGDGAGNFTVQQVIDLGVGATRGEISLGDFNEDGNMDVAYPLSSNGRSSMIKARICSFISEMAPAISRRGRRRLSGRNPALPGRLILTRTGTRILLAPIAPMGRFRFFLAMEMAPLLPMPQFS